MDWYSKNLGYLRGDDLVTVNNTRKHVFHLTEEERAALQLQPVTRDPQPENSRFYNITETPIEARIVITKEPLPLAEVAALRKADASKIRKSMETGGYTVNGIPMRTDTDSQGKLADAVALFDKAEAYQIELTSIDWEAQPGVWANITKPLANQMAVLVGLFVQKVFSSCRAHHEAIAAILLTQDTDAQKFENLVNYDVSANWPSATYPGPTP